jgi:cytochrome c-type biogenesis protein CcmH
MQSSFWFLAGLLTGVTAALLLLPVWRALSAAGQRPALRYAIAIGAILVVGSAVALLYRNVGRPEAVTGLAAPAVAPHPGARNPAPGEQPRSIEQAAAELAQRLLRDGGSRDDWLLLAQSYEYLGRSEDAAHARERAAIAPATAAATPADNARRAAAGLADYERRVAANARDMDAWLGIANLKRQQRDYTGARDAFGHLIALKAMTADSWADYADVLGSLAQGSLAGEPAHAIDKSLALDPRHPKALWLKASLAYQEKRYAAALGLWKQLRAVMPPDSPDIAIIDSNIAEAARLAGTPATETAATAPTADTGLTGTVSIDQKLAGRVGPGAVLFIYAKAVDSPGPPLAVMRTTVGAWPVSFRLDDSMAMIPSRRLSAFDRIVVEARVSMSGQATPARGDLYVVSPVMRPADGKALKLVISREVG